MITMQAFLDDYKKGRAIGLSLDSFIVQNPHHELALAMKKIHLGLYTNYPKEEAIQYANQINYKEYAVEEQLNFLELLFHIVIRTRGVNSARLILATAKRLVTTNLPVEWQIIPLSLESVMHFNEGNFKKQLEANEKELEILKLNSGRYIVLYWTYLMLLGFLNQYEKLDFHLKKFEALTIDPDIPVSLEYIYLIKNEEQGNFEANEIVLSKIRSKKPLASIKSEIDQYDNYLKVILHHQLPALDEQNQESWNLFSLYYLLTNEPKKSLAWAHKYLDLRPDYKILPNFSSYYLIRAELANKNLNAAEYLLGSRKKAGNTCIIDDFFWFRLYHSKGDLSNAQKHFNLFSANVDKFKLDNRFDLELKLSPDLLPKDIRYYTRNISTAELKEASPKITKNKSDANQTMAFIVGESKAIQQIKELVLKFATVDTSVLIIGETGTGKELIAKALWLAGPYKNKPYIAINCGAISDHLLQSELFGHKKGAFTGAYQDHKGVFEEAQDGIVFLDEIGEISPAMQVNLLRILEAREFRAIGSNSTTKLKCKVLAATNRNLAEQVKLGAFRQDLLYRLERLTIEIPPLRERSSDIPNLINHFLNEENPNLPSIFFDDLTLKYLSSLPWDGNIRELRNEMERIRLFYSDNKILTMNELSNKYKLKPASPVASQKEIAPIKSNGPSENNSPLNLNSKFRRLEELKKLFTKHRKLSSADVKEFLKVSPNTATTYINSLEKENFICKKTYTNSKSIYYEII